MTGTSSRLLGGASDAARDPYLALPLDGVRAIEASAGTGKTFTLATLVVRQVVERGMRISQILAVTFTEAATQELRSRIRARLIMAAALVGTDATDGDAPEAALTRAVLDTHLSRGTERADALRRRLQDAARDIDLAAIFTIHGFCARVLRDHALEAGHGFDAPELLVNDGALREAIAADLWRAHGVDADAADDLLALWPKGPQGPKGAQALSVDLSALVRERVLMPALEDGPRDPSAKASRAADLLLAAIEAHTSDAQAAIAHAFEGKIIHGGRVKRPSIEKAFRELLAGRARRHWPRGDKLHIEKLLPPSLRQFCYDDKVSQAPSSPLFDALQAWFDADAELRAWIDHRRVGMLHRLRDDARVRIARFKQQQRVHTYDDLIDRVADAIDGPHGDALTARLRAQYAVALVDEFQDTDPRQWRIFERVFGAASGEPALFVIGDPKQAIYGFRGGDVETYIAARSAAEEAPALSANFRSRPGVLKAIAALYAQADAAHRVDPEKHPAPFVDPRITFFNVGPGGVRRDDDYVRDGAPAPALTLWQAPAPDRVDAKGKPKSHSAGRSRELATRACVAAIHRVLADARAGNATIEGRAVQPGDIAVLVRSHNEATRIRQALALAGIPAVAAGKQSLFATDEARELHALLLAVLHGADDGRLRTALSTVLIGLDASQVAALDASAEGGDGDGNRDALNRWRLAAIGWRERLQRGGPLALVNELCAQHAARLLGLLDGERRLTNYLQLAELLQEVQARALGLHGLVDWLARSIAEASADDDSQLLRLESDARRVQVVTLHKSKGLEYPLVFLPFAGVGGKPRDAGRHVTVSRDGTRTLHWKLLPTQSGWEAAKDQWQSAQQAEDARLLYVGLTRARHALWLAGGAFYNHARAAIAAMIADPDALVAATDGAIAIDRSTPPDTLPWLPPESEETVPPARIATRALASDWWVYSFTQLANADGAGDASSAATQPAAGGQDEATAEPATDQGVANADDADTFDPRFAGARFGVVLHDVLERVDFAGWAAWTPGEPAPGGDVDILVERLRAAGYAENDIDDGVAVLTPLVGQTLIAPLPEGVRLADVPDGARRAEMEFQFALAPTRVDALLGLLHRHGLVRARQGFGVRRRLEGLMTGLIDLTYLHDGHWYVLDYKSNRLPGYGPAQLSDAMAHSEYDLQALIYTLALHRWLRFRLGDGYDYARDFGGARYLFCRGLDATRDDAPGVQAWRFEPALVEALDALFAGRATEVAA